jgi:tetratricopeptide (TPR) repeat protein
VAKKKSGKGAVTPSRVTMNPKPAVSPPMDLWDRIAWTCLHILVILVPIAMSNLGPFSPNGVPITFDQFDIAKVFIERGLMIIAASTWLIGILVRGGRVRFTRGEWVLVAFIAWLVLTTVFSVHPPTAIFGKYRRFEGLLSFLTYAVTFFLALQLADRPARVRSLARSLAIGGFLVAWYGAIQVVGTISIEVARVLQPVAVVLTVLLPLGLAYLAIARTGDDPEARRAAWIGAVIALLGGIMFSAGLAQNIDTAVLKMAGDVALDPVRWGSLPFEPNRAFSTFGNPDLLGGYLIFPWAVTLGLALSEKHPLWRWIYWCFSLLNVFVGITSYVRGAWIGAVVSLVLIVIAYRRARAGTDMRLTGTDRAFIGGTAITGVAVMVASSLRPDAVRNVLTRVISIFQFAEGSAQTRFQIWEAALAAVAARPIFGWGADTFRLLFPMFKPAEYVKAAGYLSVADNVHNYPLQLASGIGIPGALLFYGIITVALVIAARQVFARSTGASRLLMAGFWAAVAGYVVHLMFGLSVTGSTIMMWLSMGVLLSPASTVRDVKPPSWRGVAIAAVTVLLLAGSFLNLRYIIADTHYLAGRVLTQGTDRVAEIERAIELNPYNDMYRLELGSAWRDLFRASAEQYAQAAQEGAGDPELLRQTLDLYDRAVAAYEDMIAYVPQEYDTYVFLANLHNEAATYVDPGYADRAIDAASRGVAIEKYGPAARVQLAMALLLTGRAGDAIPELEFAVSLDPAYRQAYMMLAEAYRRDGRIEDARATLEGMLARNPADQEAQGALEALDASAATVPAR